MTNFKHYLSLMTIMRGEAPYILDWAKYHLGLGFDHLYIYDNDPLNDNTASNILRGNFSTQEVTIQKVFEDTKQAECMNKAITSLKGVTRWLALFDVDEYMTVKTPFTDIKQELINYESYPALCVHWRLFGSNGHQKYEDKPVPERFTRAASDIDRHVKSIVNPLRTSNIITVHKCHHPDGHAVDEKFNQIADNDSRPEPAIANKFQLSHYVTKSFEECAERRNRPRADIPAKHQMPEFFHGHDRNEVEDLSTYNIWMRVK